MNPKVKELPKKKCVTIPKQKGVSTKLLTGQSTTEIGKSLYKKGLSSTTNNYQLAKMPNQNILCNFLLNLLHSTPCDKNSVLCNTAILVVPKV